MVFGSSQAANAKHGLIVNSAKSRHAVVEPNLLLVCSFRSGLKCPHGCHGVVEDCPGCTCQGIPDVLRVVFVANMHSLEENVHHVLIVLHMVKNSKPRMMSFCGADFEGSPAHYSLTKRCCCQPCDRRSWRPACSSTLP